MQSFFDNCDQHVNRDGSPDLGFDRVFAVSVESFDAKMLLDPAEKGLDLPSASVQFGDCYDNAMVESFFATLKSEWLQDRCFETLEELRVELRSYIDDFYNARRLHSSLGYVSPNEYEAGFRKADLAGASPSQVRSHDLAQTYV